MGHGTLYFKHFSVKGLDLTNNTAIIIVSLADNSHTLELIKHLLLNGRDYEIEFTHLTPVFFQWARNSSN